MGNRSESRSLSFKTILLTINLMSTLMDYNKFYFEWLLGIWLQQLNINETLRKR